MTAAQANSAIVGLKEETVEKLKELRQINVDSAKGFQECAELVDDIQLKGLFTELGVERSDQAKVLETQIDWNENDIHPEDGSYLAACHRAWIKLKDCCSSDNTQSLLDEAERGEDMIKEAYEDVLGEIVDSPVHQTVSTQYAAVKRAHDRVRDLRDAHRQANS